MSATIFTGNADVSGSVPGTAREFWLRRVGYGLLLGALIGLLEFAYYHPLVPTPDGFGLGLLGSLLLPFCAEGLVLALTVGLFERWQAPRPLGARRLALAVVTASTAGVLGWQILVHLVLRERFGILQLRDYMSQPVDVTSVALYHIWLMLMFGGLAAAVYLSQQRHARMLAVLRAAEIAREASRQKLAEARLAALRASVDPEFLFETLTKLERLYEADSAGADRLLDELIVFLRRAVADSRSAGTTAAPAPSHGGKLDV